MYIYICIYIYASVWRCVFIHSWNNCFRSTDLSLSLSLSLHVSCTQVHDTYITHTSHTLSLSKHNHTRTHHTHTDTHTRTHTHGHTHRHTHRHARTHKRTHKRTLTHTHTHIPSVPSGTKTYRRSAVTMAFNGSRLTRITPLRTRIVGSHLDSTTCRSRNTCVNIEECHM